MAVDEMGVLQVPHAYGGWEVAGWNPGGGGVVGRMSGCCG